MHSKHIVILVLSALLTCPTYAQSIEKTNDAKRVLSDFLRSHLPAAITTPPMDSIAKYSRLEPLYTFKGKKAGIYIMVPPIDPQFEFIVIVNGDNLRPLPTKMLEQDLPIILSFLRNQKPKRSSKEFLDLMDKVILTYQRQNERKYPADR